MPLAAPTPEYEVSTFLDMQKELANYLNEAHDIDGTWTIAEKKRMINRGCVAVATATMTPRLIFNKILYGTTSTPIVTVDLPAGFIKTIHVFIDGVELKELQTDDYLKLIGVTDGSVSINKNVYWVDESANKIYIHPHVTTQQTFNMYYVSMPRKLVNDDDVSNINPAFTYLPPLWAASMMCYRDEEHRDRGAKAQNDYVNGLLAFESYKKHTVGDKLHRIILDRSQFKQSRQLDGADDADDFWDRTP